MPEFNLDFLYKYFVRTNRYFYSNEVDNDAPVIEVFSATQVASEDEESIYTSGVAFANTNYFNNYNTFDFHKSNVIESRIRESTQTEDGKIFYLKHGPWFSAVEPIVIVVNHQTRGEVATEGFISFPDEGKIILDDELDNYQSVIVTIPQDINFKLGAEFSSYDDDVEVSDIGIMWNNDERGLTSNVADRIPVVENVYINSTNAVGGNALYANYVLYDRNGNYIMGDGLSLGVTIDWYRNGSLQSAYKNVIRIPGRAVQHGQAWHFVVTPHDDIRSGNPVTSPTIAIGRGRPIATNVVITPSVANTENDLVLTYNYDSPDGTSESNSEYRWYLGGILQSQYNGRIAIFSSETSSGQSWYATVRPHDGYNFGDMVQSNTVVIGHTPPTLGNSLVIDPGNPSSADDLSAQYNFNSVEGLDEARAIPNWEEDHPDEDYPEGNTIIRWYKNGILQSALNNHYRVDNTFTSVGNEWFVEFEPGDGISRGITFVSQTIVVS